MRETNNAKQESNAQKVSKLIRLQATGGSPLLVVLSGPSHAGKSTFAQRLGENFTTISSDEIRRQLNVSFDGREHEAGMWKLFESRKCKALKEGRDVILDACHISRQARWHSLQGSNGHHRKICVVFDLPLRAIRARCIKVKRLSLEEAERMWRAFHDSMPTLEELKKLGFDDVYFVKE